MSNLPFVLWVVLFPLGNAVERYLRWLREGTEDSEFVEAVSALISLAVWISIAHALYVPQ